MKMVVKLTICFVFSALFMAIFLYTKSDFLVAGGSESAEMIFRVELISRIGFLVLTIVTFCIFVFHMRTVTTIAMITGVLLFIASQNVVRISGKNFVVEQSFAAFPVKTWKINDNQPSNITSIAGNWCCLTMEQAKGKKTLVTGIWPLKLAQDRLKTSLSSLYLE